MTAILKDIHARPAENAWWQWVLLAFGYLALYMPTYVALAKGPWNDEQNSHGPFVLLVVIWLFYRNRGAFSKLPEHGALWSGSLLLALGLALVVVGRAVEVIYFEAFSQIPVVAGLLLLIYGRRGLSVASFALLYMMFLVPLPGVVMEAATGPLKHLVSVIAESTLYHAGYPVARHGVVLTIGPYQLLVADACSGLNSMYSLTAMGLLFLHVMDGGSWARKAFLMLSILPIAFVANVLRVVILVLVTYHLGDEAGQGFLHGFSGILLFVASMAMLAILHILLGRILPSHRARVSA